MRRHVLIVIVFLIALGARAFSKEISVDGKYAAAIVATWPHFSRLALQHNISTTLSDYDVVCISTKSQVHITYCSKKEQPDRPPGYLYFGGLLKGEAAVTFTYDTQKQSILDTTIASME